MGATARVSRSLLTADDIRAAIRWRLEGIPARDVETLAKVLRPLAGDFREDRPEVAAVLGDLRPKDGRRGAWSLACAVLAWDADKRSDASLVWAAGIDVVTAHRNALRAARPRAGDQLSALILEHLRYQPEATGPGLFRHFGELAGPAHDVLADFDGALLTYRPRAGREDLKDIGDHAFCERVSTLRNQVNALA